MTQIAESARSFKLASGLELRADTYGDSQNQTVILAHGGGQTRHSWGDTAKVLASNGWFSVAYDLRGHGESDWARDKDYALPRFGTDLAELCQQLQDENGHKPVVVGASLGGLSGMLAGGEAAPGSLRALVLVDITPNMNQGGAQNVIGFMSERIDEGFESLEEAAELIAEYTRRPLRKNVDGLKKNLRLHDDGRYRWHWDPEFTRQRQNKERLGLSERAEKAAKNINAPMLLVRGARSDLVTVEIAEEFLRMVPGTEYVDVANAHHMVAGDKNDIFTAAVVDFLQRLP